MNVENARAYMLSLPSVVETVQWGDNLVFWVGDKSLGGKMFSLVDLDGSSPCVISYAAGAEAYYELLERDGIRPAPYLARAFWIGVERWDVFRRSEWEAELARAHQLTAEKLPLRTRALLELTPQGRERAVSRRPKPTAKQATRESSAKARS